MIHLVVSREELLRRLHARAQSEGRGDDTDGTIAHRLDVFAAETEPLLGFYAQRGLVLEIDGEQSVDQVFVDITTAVDRGSSGP